MSIGQQALFRPFWPFFCSTIAALNPPSENLWYDGLSPVFLRGRSTWNC